LAKLLAGRLPSDAHAVIKSAQEVGHCGERNLAKGSYFPVGDVLGVDSFPSMKAEI
jgi:hypothetical protein